jgi:membrane protease YdiL (CAAX protease family)
MEAVAPAIPVFASALVAFGLVVLVRGREAFALRWRLDADAAAAIATGLLAATLSASMLYFPPRTLARDLLHFVGIYGVCGGVLPWWWVTRVERAGPEAMGLTRERWKAALLIGVVAGAALGTRVLTAADFSRVAPGYLALASYNLLVGGLFELFLYYGFLHLRLDRAFGPIPAIVGSAAIYTLWHLGTELPMHTDPWRGLTLLFAVGLLYHAVFQLTRHLLSIWPFFFLGGVWNDFAIQLDFPPVLAERPAWPTLSLLLLVAVPWWLVKTRGGDGPR